MRSRMSGGAWAAAAVAAAVAAGGCATRATAYRFRAPLVYGVSAPEVPPPSVLARMEVPSAPARRAPAATGSVAPPSGSPMATALRRLVGKHESEWTSAQLAVRAVTALGLALADDVAGATDGPALVAAARARQATFRDKPLLGDLVVFDGLQGSGPASLIGVVVERRDDGTVEFVYLGMGVVRRGYLNTRRPAAQRDRAGRILNTWLRIKRGNYRKGLAGELFSTYLRAERLLR